MANKAETTRTIDFRIFSRIIKIRLSGNSGYCFRLFKHRFCLVRPSFLFPECGKVIVALYRIVIHRPRNFRHAFRAIIKRPPIRFLLSSGFTEIGNFYVESSGSLVVADRLANYVYRVFADGTRVAIAGNGTTTGGGDGSPALSTGIYGPRGVWPVPTGGYLLLLHDGAQLCYVDSSNTMHLLVNGLGGNGYVHNGDGQYFYAPDEYRIGEGRSVSMDCSGNIIICESDYGFIRRIRFQRMTQ